MNNLFFSGHIAKMAEHGPPENRAMWFMLVREEIVDDVPGREPFKRQVTLTFNAYGMNAAFVREHARVGSQLHVEASIQNNNYTDGQGVNHYEYAFKVQLVGLGAPAKVRRINFRKRERQPVNVDHSVLEAHSGLALEAG